CRRRRLQPPLPRLFGPRRQDRRTRARSARHGDLAARADARRRREDALDNAMCESLIGTMKIEKLNRQPWRSVEDVRAAVFEWIETWYNRRRRHSSLGYLSPLEFESQHYDGHPITNR
ncbi:MAG: integrase core domain-containing protein, partial [Thermoleophilaceae bacterium]